MTVTTTIRSGSDRGEWTQCPIRPNWILEGAPVARIQLLSESADGTASTWFWDCTAGRFNWFYSFDETLHILEGGFTFKDLLAGTTRRAIAGDVVYFPKGAQAEWTVEKYVRKLAFCRSALPGFLVSARDLARRARSLVRPGQAADGGMFSG